jgi:hypothetical protein
MSIAKRVRAGCGVSGNNPVMVSVETVCGGFMFMFDDIIGIGKFGTSYSDSEDVFRYWSILDLLPSHIESKARKYHFNQRR